MTSDKPYRPNVGIALFNAAGFVLICGVIVTTDLKSSCPVWSGRCRKAALMPMKIRATR